MFKVLLKNFIYDTAIAVFMDRIFKNFSTPEKLIQLDVDSLTIGDEIYVVHKQNSDEWCKGYVQDIQCNWISIDPFESYANDTSITAFNPEYYFIYKI